MRFDFQRNDNYEYVVKKGDSLYKIAKEYNVTVDELLKTNGLTNALIYPNQVLIIPVNANGSVYFVEYLVKENDTLDTIANKYNISLNALKDYNNFEKLYLTSDQVIKIPLENNTHEVVATDTIEYILNKYNMSYQELVELNKDKLLITGVTLYVK